MNYAQELEMLMKHKGYSMYRLAKEMPCSQTAVKKWLDGSIPNPVMRARITEILGELPKEKPASISTDGREVNPRYYELSDSERAAVDALTTLPVIKQPAPRIKEIALSGDDLRESYQTFTRQERRAVWKSVIDRIDVDGDALTVTFRT